MKTLENYMHDFERFGYSPLKLKNRFFGSTSVLPKIITITMPKSGTNLLQRILTLHPMLYRKLLPSISMRRNYVSTFRRADILSNLDKFFKTTKNGQIISSHFEYNQKIEDYLVNEVKHKMIFMMRDPRDVVVSAMYYILKRKDHPLREMFLRIPNEKEMLIALICGKSGAQSIDSKIQGFMGWINPRVHVVKFEDAVGTAGGGNDQIQREVIRKLYDYLEIDTDDSLLEYISRNCRSSKTQTYRSGKINNWRTHFDDELKEVFKDIAGELLIKMDYEKDFTW